MTHEHAVALIEGLETIDSIRVENEIFETFVSERCVLQPTGWVTITIYGRRADDG